MLCRAGVGEGPASPWEHLADIQAGALTRELIYLQNICLGLLVAV